MTATTNVVELPARPEGKIRLAQLEPYVVDVLVAQGRWNPTRKQIGAIGSQVVDAGNLEFYTSEKYGKGSDHRWLAASTEVRIRQALAEREPTPEAESDNPPSEQSDAEQPSEQQEPVAA